MAAGFIATSIVDNLIKFLGKWFNASPSDGANVAEAVEQTYEWRKKIDRSGLPGKFKTRLYKCNPGQASSAPVETVIFSLLGRNIH